MNEIEKRIIDTIDAHAEEIKAFGRDIWHHAELGYREFRTSSRFTEEMSKLGMTIRDKQALTGVKAYLKPEDTEGPVIALLGEMDALPIANNPDTNPETGAAHCCGHNAQLTAVFGAALALALPEIKEKLDGNIVFFAVPSEEYVGDAYYDELFRAGKISYGGGKCELIHTGAMDDIDMCIGTHSTTGSRVIVKAFPNNGFVTKTVTFHGKATHAAATPYLGSDAFAAANLAIHAVDMQRESFREKDAVRIHGYMTKNAPAVNIIADEVVMKYSVRASNNDAIMDASAKVDRAMLAGAVASGCGVTIENEAGYLPRRPCQQTEILESVCKMFADQYKYVKDGPSNEPKTASSDDGDVSNIMPLFSFSTGGMSSPAHSADMHFIDEDLAYVVPAKIFALTAYRMLSQDAAAARDIIANNKPNLSKDEYLTFKESMRGVKDYTAEQLASL